MPPTLQALIADRRPLKVPVNGKPLTECGPDDLVTLIYRPSAVNLAAEEKTRRMREEGQPAIYRLAAELADVLVSWDVVQPKAGPNGAPALDGSGQPVMEPVQLTTETLGSLGIKRLNEWHAAIWEDLFPDPTTPASNSRPGSPETGS